MIQVQLRATIDETLHGGRIELTEQWSIAFEPLEEVSITDQGHFHCLDIARALIPRRKRCQQLKIDDHQKRQNKARSGWSDQAAPGPRTRREQRALHAVRTALRSLRRP